MTKFILGCLCIVNLIAVVGCTGMVVNHYVQQQDVAPREDLPDIMFVANRADKYPPVVRLHDSTTGKFFCSGTVIGKNYIVTAGHCLADRSRHKATIEIRTIDNKSVGVLGIAAFYEGRSDQGLILGEFSDFNEMQFEERPMLELMQYTQQDDFMVACGFPYGGELFCSPLMHRHQLFFAIGGDGFLYPGMSGGPVFNPKNQVVIGVNTAAFDNEVMVSPLVEVLVHAGIKRGGVSQ